ncbi:hypothetical protein [Leisingera caerulea]|uniref:hypothetical protein n=1 Tax=Leisingera caerulea TaxID=506591 RepID=UPI000418BD45|nr:hypothetical protein [Leisingera caerulea]
MNTITIKSVAVLGLMSLAACGGGSGSTGGSPVTPPPAATAPASNSSADLLDYVVDGGAVVYNQHTNENNMTRLQRSEVVNGERHTVTVDRLADGTYGLIQYVKGDEATLYTMDDGLVASTDVPDGQFNGAFEVSYTVDGGSTWNIGSGEASVTLDTATGQAHFGGMATDRSVATGDFNSVEYYSTANLVNGEFSDNAASVIYREDGASVSTHTGTIDGIVVGSGDDAGVIGLVGGTDGDFQANGGFTLSPYTPD